MIEMDYEAADLLILIKFPKNHFFIIKDTPLFVVQQLN